MNIAYANIKPICEVYNWLEIYRYQQTNKST